MLRMKYFLIIFFLLILGCATTEKYSKICDSWIGHDINALIRKWGYPKESFALPNGNKVYVFYDSRSVYIPQHKTPTRSTYNVYGNTIYGTTTGGQTYGGYTIGLNCQTFFETNPSGKIVHWRWKGNDCTAK